MCVGGPPNLQSSFMEALLLQTGRHRGYDTTQSDNCISSLSTICARKDGFVVTRDILPEENGNGGELGTTHSALSTNSLLKRAGCVKTLISCRETLSDASAAPFLYPDSSLNVQKPSEENQRSRNSRTQSVPTCTQRKTRMKSNRLRALSRSQSRKNSDNSASLTAHSALGEELFACTENRVICAIVKQVLSTCLFSIAAILAVFSCMMIVALPFPVLKQSEAIQLNALNSTREVDVSASCWNHPWENRVLGFFVACLCFTGRSWLWDLRYWKRGNGCWRCENAVECTRNRAKEAEDEAHKAQRTKQQFMAYVFHNIRVPFNAIVLGLGHLRATVGKETPGIEVCEKMDLVQMMLDCAETMTSVLDDVTDMGQWEDNAMKLELEEFDLLAVVTFLSWGMKDLLYQKQICFTMNVDSVVREVLTSNHVIGDKHRVLQTLGNFLSNAVKFTPIGGRLELSISCEGVLRTNVQQCSSELDIQESIQSHGCSLCPSLRVECLNKPSMSHSIDRFSGQYNGAKFRISVKDTGIGISSEDQLKLFEPYSFVTSGWVQKVGVSGLGLSMAKHFAEQSGGNIGVLSKEGEGSTFYFAIPYTLVPVQHSVQCKAPSKEVFFDHYGRQIHQCLEIWDGPLPLKCSNSTILQERSFHRAMPPKPQKSNSRRVLLVEDTEINRVILRKVLQNLNLHCEEAENGQVAVDFLKQGRNYDLILMDKEMPIMDGHEATRQLRMMGIKTPIVALTGNALQSDRELFFEAGVDDFQTKPLSRDKLVQLLARFGVESSCANKRG